MRFSFVGIVALISVARLCAFGQEVVTVRPVEIGEVLSNPGIGFSTFQTFNGDPVNPTNGWTEGYPVDYGEFDGDRSNKGYPDTTIAYLRINWRFLEPKKYQYNWVLIDKALETANERGQTLMLRVAPHGSRQNIGYEPPDWYVAIVGEPKRELPKKDMWLVDPEDPNYVKYFGGFIRAMGNRYDGHPYLESVDLSILAAWGEGSGSKFLTQKTREALVDCYVESFKETALVMLLTDDATNRYGLSKGNLGWRADCLGDMGGFVSDGSYSHMNDWYPQSIVRFGLGDAWKKGPVVFEVCWRMQRWKDEGWDVYHIIDESLKWHISSFNAKSSGVPAEWGPQIDRWLKKMGYRFVLRKFTYPASVKSGGEMAITSWWDNKGVAPCYKEFPLMIRLKSDTNTKAVSTKADIRTWLPGDIIYDENVTVPMGLPAGTYELGIGICDRYNDEPAVRLAIAGRGADGWYRMGEIKLLD